MQEPVYTTKQTNRIANHSSTLGKFEVRSRERGNNDSARSPHEGKTPLRGANREGRVEEAGNAAYFCFLSTAVAGLSTSAL